MVSSILRLRFHRRWLAPIVLATFCTLLLNLFFVSSQLERGLWPWRPPLKDPDPQEWTEQTSRMDLAGLRKLVASTNGYYVRDWSVGLGWNNLRYIIETSLLHAKLLNRVLVLPSYVYARNCEFADEVCAQYGLFVDRTEVIGWNTWDGAPLNTLAWKLPIQVMLDLPHLREAHPVILGSEFFLLQGLDPGFESLAGDWNRGDYEVDVKFPTIHTIPNGDYDPSRVVRVDTLRGLPVLDKKDDAVNATLTKALSDKLVLDWDDAVSALRAGQWKMDTDADVESVINSGDWVITYTYLGAGGMDYTKTVVDPIRQVAPRSRVRGFVEDYSHITEEVLYMEGEIHLGRKPGGLRFTTESARTAFSCLVLFDFRPIAPIRTLAKTLAARMTARTDGRMWMAAHMRRGDFVAVGWSMEKSLEGHYARVQDRLTRGREILEKLKMTTPQTYNILGVKPTPLAAPPREGDPILLATDERDPEGLRYLRNNSAVLVYDLLTIEDRRKLGWLLLYTDILALVEQNLVMQSSYFYGHALSSFAGGVLNMRAARGADPRTILID